MREITLAALVGFLVVSGCKSEGGQADGEDATDMSGDEQVDEVTEVVGDDGMTAEVECSVDGDCDDGDPCTTDVCDPDLGCVNDPMDVDGDGYAAENVGTTACGGTDCDDTRDDVHPGATRACDGVDHDCSGRADEDEDADGYRDPGTCADGDDCDDGNADANPGAPPDCGNDFDADCDGVVDCADPSCGDVECPCTEMEWLCEGGGDEDCDGDADCDDSDCTAPCACGTACAVGQTCCNHGCCDTLNDTGCCGECGIACEGGEMCCDGECAECCHHLDCDDSNSCTVDTCVSGTCVNDAALTDMLACPGGVCCSGTCIVGGNCCRDTDCGCMGMAMPCSSMTTDATCSSQTGCAWDDQSCRRADAMQCEQMTDDQCYRCTNCTTGSGGMCAPGGTGCIASEACSDFDLQEDCEACGCTWTSGTCSGTADCDGFPDIYSWMCWICPGCYHVPGLGECSGAHPPCSSYGSADCALQVGCSWLPDCTDNVCVGL